MPSTTLESLVIEINGNSEKASEGIGKLIGSLRSLRSCVSTVAPSLRTLNADLRAIAQNSRDLIKTADAVKAITKAVNATKTKSGVIPEFKNAVKNNQFASWMYGPNPKPTISGLGESNGTYRPPNRRGFFSFEDYKGKDWRQENSEDTAYFKRRLGEITDQTDALKNMRENTRNMCTAFQSGQPVSSAQAIKQASNELKNANTAGNTAKQGLENASQGFKQVGESAEETAPRFSLFQRAMERVNGTLHRIGRMASTLLIRTALKSMIKAFGEAWNAVYGFSNSINGQFASSIDSMKSALSATAITIVQTFAPLVSAVVPVINVIAGAIQYLCSVIQSLLQLLGMTSELFGASASKIRKYGGSGGGSGNKGSSGKKKGLLADWDELNVIQSSSETSGGSGGGGGGGGSKLSDIVKTEIDAITSLLVGEGLIAVGLFMCATGHFGWGLGMIAIGAASIAQTLTVQWGGLSDNVKREIMNIMGIVAGAFVALGLILAFTGHIGIGIGLIAVGAANLAASVAVSWGEGISSGVRQALGKVLAISSAIMFVFGLILCLTGVGVGLGIGMMVASGLFAASAIALNWDSIVETIKETLANVVSTVREKFSALKAIVSAAWSAISKWWTTNVTENVEKAWNSVTAFFDGLFGENGSVTTTISNAWDSVSQWWTTNIGEKIEAVWETVCDAFKSVFGSTEDDGVTILGLFGEAWNYICQWWGDILTPVTKAWDAVKEYFSGLLGDSENGTGIIGAFSELWIQISQLWSNVTESVETAWKGISKWFEDNVTTPISNAFKSAMNVIIGFINTAIDGLNSVGNFTIPGWSVTMPDWLGGGTFGWSSQNVSLFSIGHIAEFATGAYDIPKGDLFIANEAGAELVGSMNGKTAVANNGQIIEGIENGVVRANSEQNALLRTQNDLLRQLIARSGNQGITPSAEWGQFIQRSSDMWNAATGR